MLGVPNICLYRSSQCGFCFASKQSCIQDAKHRRKQPNRWIKQREVREKIKVWQRPTLGRRNPYLSSAQTCFTTEFEMGSGGTKTLWLPDQTDNEERRKVQKRCLCISILQVRRLSNVVCSWGILEHVFWVKTSPITLRAKHSRILKAVWHTKCQCQSASVLPMHIYKYFKKKQMFFKKRGERATEEINSVWIQQ